MKEENNLDELQVYEVSFHILPTVPEEKLPEVVSKLAGSIAKDGGSIISEEFPKIRALAYDVKKRVETKYLSFSKAYFGWIKFEMIPAAVEAFKKEIEKNEDILRFIIVKTVRENTMSSIKPPTVGRENNKEEIAKKVPKEKVEVSEEQIDKSIDELLVNESVN
jgi:ribosomal protein S6